MKITHAGLTDAFVLEVDVGEAPVWEVDYGETKLYPDTETGVKEAKFRAPEQGTEDWCYFMHALNAAKKECSAECNMVLRVAGREYSLFGSVNGLPAAQLTGEGYAAFPAGHAPSLQEMAPGTSAWISATIPKRPGVTLTGDYPGGTVRRVEELPWLDGTLFKARNTKGKKRVCSWVRATLRGNRYGQTYLQGSGTDQGHGRGARSKTFAPAAGAHMDGDPAMTLEVAYGGACWLDWARLEYPAFARTWELPLEGIAYCQEDDDQYHA